MTETPKRWTAMGPATGETWVSWFDRRPPRRNWSYPQEDVDRIRRGYARIDEELRSGPITRICTATGHVIHSQGVYRTGSGRLTSPAPKIDSSLPARSSLTIP